MQHKVFVSRSINARIIKKLNVSRRDFMTNEIPINETALRNINGGGF